jgi:hypothetical protein
MVLRLKFVERDIFDIFIITVVFFTVSSDIEARQEN